jgi:hypothetical protein
MTVVPGRAPRGANPESTFLGTAVWIPDSRAAHARRNDRSGLMQAGIITTGTIIDSSLREGEAFAVIQVRDVTFGLLRFARNDGQSFCNLVLRRDHLDSEHAACARALEKQAGVGATWHYALAHPTFIPSTAGLNFLGRVADWGGGDR